MTALLLLLTLAQPAPAAPYKCYTLTINYATPPSQFPGVRVPQGEPSPTIGEWNLTGKIPTTAAEAADPAFQGGITNATVADFLEKKAADPKVIGPAKSQLTTLAAKIRAMPTDIGDALYSMESGSVIGPNWNYSSESGIANATFTYQGYAVFVQFKRMPLEVLLPEVEP